jgi:hypothetical protein
MNGQTIRKAINPEDLAKFFVEFANAGDVDGLVSLYEPRAMLVIDNKGSVANGHAEIKAFYSGLLSSKPKFEPGKQAPPIMNGNLALTSSKLINGIVTAEVARLQPDKTWLWAIDQPAIAREK